MKLYTFDPAPNPARLTMFMAYKGIEIETEQVNLMEGAHFKDEYRALVPAMTVPALVLDDGTVMSEVIGICVYLEALYPEKPLLGSTPQEKGQVISWDHRLFNEVLVAIAEILRNTSPAFKDRGLPGPLDVAQLPELAERGRFRLAEAWKELDATLAGRQWLAGDNFSFADIDMVACESFSGWVKEKPPESLANLHGYLARARAELGIAE
ncbi:glutathione S-transferase family protein [Mangrovimicrobium sediminis]|uniref:Glutathione S-transferase family protein n=1 Tax=Mangrovimicrobium sediminis TaxID=2562682 RepID=A0A4Z0LXI0_9GAMM|nr:glutathione S-transferase family protein [Haliea sp. SAOS-164]TGD71847.1 glutathione S-transferase family protein [Haliea sp. SAOS-164]